MIDLNTVILKAKTPAPDWFQSIGPCYKLLEYGPPYTFGLTLETYDGEMAFPYDSVDYSTEAEAENAAERFVKEGKRFFKDFDPEIRVSKTAINLGTVVAKDITYLDLLTMLEGKRIERLPCSDELESWLRKEHFEFYAGFTRPMSITSFRIKDDAATL